MKKIFSLILVCLLITLTACGNTQNPPETTSNQQAAVLQAGFGKESITPDAPVGMRGYGDPDTRKSGVVLDPIYATCIAFHDGSQTFLVYTVDVCGLGETETTYIRDYVTAFMDIPAENIFIGATHTHSAPQPFQDAAWDNILVNACLNAAMAATADLAPIQLEATTATLESMNFVRHYLMNDGTYYGSNFGSIASGFKAHALEYPDRQIVLLKLNRTDKKDILMVNWQGHPASAARQDDYTGISADFVGYTRNALETETGMLVAYYTGASGNTNTKSLIESENVKNNNNYKDYGKQLAKEILAILPNLTPMDGTDMKATRVAFEAEIDHSWDHMLKEANEVYEVWMYESQSEGNTLGKKYGFTSGFQARAIRTRAALPATQPRELRAFRVGPIGFTTGTYEMFSDHSQYVKENSPFDITFIITGCDGYIGNEASYTYRSYESDTGMFASGTGEKIAAEYVKLLNAVK